jgi:segregation and condensation protein B
MDRVLVKRIIEGAIFAAHEPLSLAALGALFHEEDQITAPLILTLLSEIESDLSARSFELKQVAGGYRFQIKSDLSQWIVKLWDEKPAKYSRAVLETLALIAYRQPVTRAEIEDIRGVTASSAIIKILMERSWVKIVGYKDVPGKPGLLATTPQFLDYFNLQSLEDLPTLTALLEIEEK